MDGEAFFADQEAGDGGGLAVAGEELVGKLQVAGPDVAAAPGVDEACVGPGMLDRQRPGLELGRIDRRGHKERVPVGGGDRLSLPVSGANGDLDELAVVGVLVGHRDGREFPAFGVVVVRPDLFAGLDICDTPYQGDAYDIPIPVLRWATGIRTKLYFKYRRY